MSSVVINGDTSGSVTLSAPAVAGSVTVTLPASSGTMAVTGASQSFTDITATGNLTVNGNTTLGDASTDTILMTGAPSIGGAGLGMGMGFRNRIINGAMVIDQRNAGAVVTVSLNPQYMVDRWQTWNSPAGKFTFQQTPSTTETGFATRVSAGFTNYLAITSNSAYSISASDYFAIEQCIEGNNVSDLAFGTANAKTVTISFWVRSSLTGTFGGYIKNSAADRSYVFSYSISSANTWEQKTVTIAGDQSGTWLTTNGIGLRLGFSFGTGSSSATTAGAWTAGNYSSVSAQTSVVGTNGATFYITGVQLEKGSTATSFDYRPYGTELQLCQRYYWRAVAGANFTSWGTANIYNTTTAQCFRPFPVTMRTTPTTFEFASAGTYKIDVGPTAYTCTGIGNNANCISPNAMIVDATTAGTMITGQAGILVNLNNTTGYIGVGAEL